ncbi:hypothetical protein L596_017342 [Steinernema carpocapsae]|uniref:BTB domain-containing protein n=1 Tax=Steinernema carpocapsae TaxID=34508 RepID=A0A4V6A1P0_STECR|nr:hypothetical protein L596_017342 [Steinernema carpocapsae]
MLVNMATFTEPEKKVVHKHQNDIDWFLQCSVDRKDPRTLKFKLSAFARKAVIWTECRIRTVVKRGTETIIANSMNIRSVVSSTEIAKMRLTPGGNGRITVKMDVEVTRWKIFNFKEAARDNSTFKITLDKAQNTVHVSKNLLAFHSKYFKDLIENEKVNEHHMEKTELKHLLIVLQRMYGIPVAYNRLTKQTLLHLISLAHRIGFDMMLSEVETYLLTLPYHKLINWFTSADVFDLARLREEILEVLPDDKVNVLMNSKAHKGRFSQDTMNDLKARIKRGRREGVDESRAADSDVESTYSNESVDESEEEENAEGDDENDEEP